MPWNMCFPRRRAVVQQKSYYGPSFVLSKWSQVELLFDANVGQYLPQFNTLDSGHQELESARESLAKSGEGL